MAALALWAGLAVIRQARGELVRAAAPIPAPAPVLVPVPGITFGANPPGND